MNQRPMASQSELLESGAGNSVWMPATVANQQGNQKWVVNFST